jgi:hypothetical protein
MSNQGAEEVLIMMTNITVTWGTNVSENTENSCGEPLLNQWAQLSRIVF